MKIKKIALTGVSLVFLAITTLCALTTYGTVDWLQRNPLEVDFSNTSRVSARVIENLILPDHPVVEVYTQAGDIAVQVAEVDRITLEIIKTAWGRNEAEARVSAAEMHLNIEQNGETLKLHYQPRLRKVRIFGRPKIDRLSLSLKIPAQTQIYLQSGDGDIHLINQ